VVGHRLDFDTLFGGEPYLDPDGDSLKYKLTIEGGVTWNGLSAVGTRIVGTPPEPLGGSAQLLVEDGRGGRLQVLFALAVVPNQPPQVASPLEDRIVDVGAPLDIDVRGNPAAFSDEAADALTYQITFKSAAPGLAVQGNRVVGALDSSSVVFVKVQARDILGETAEDTFAIATPVALDVTPTLPQTSYIYADEELTLPHVVRFARANFAPLWDTTPQNNPTTNAGATLGRVLFYDKRLSITNTLSCGSCHEQQHGFARPERFTAGLLGVMTKRNVMGLTAVRYNLAGTFFGDLRVSHLENLVLLPIQDEAELGMSLPLLERKLADTDFYPPLFEAAFGTPEITADRIALAVAQFLRSMIAFESKFDRAFHPMEVGDPERPELLTDQELRGREIFQSEGRCARCHALGAQTMDTPGNNGLDATPIDEGFARGIFRTASLRNVALTAPYMHDGRFATLREVIEHYSTGAVDSPLIDVRMRQLPENFIHRNFSEEDKDALEAFLHTFTDMALTTDPKFSDPFQ
jgi:cytochrome c peroxidase